MSDRPIESLFLAFKEFYNRSSIKEEKVIIYIKLGKQIAAINFSHKQIRDKLMRSISHLVIPNVESPDLTIFCFDDKYSVESVADSFTWNSLDLGIQGLINSYTNERFQTAYQHGSGAIMMFDQESKEGIYWINDSSAIPYWEVSFPFRTLFHWWSKDTPYQLLHSGGIGTDTFSAIISGKSGSGKSSTCLSAILNKNLSLAGDDYIMINTKENTLYSLYTCAKVEWDNLKRMPDLKQFTDDEFKDADKAMLFMSEKVPKQILLESDVRFSFIPVISGQNKTIIEETYAAESLKSIAPTTLFQLPLFQKEAFLKCSALLKGINTYRVSLGTDPREISDSLHDFLISHQY